MFIKFFPIRVFKLAENSGPGIARQYGLDRATQEFVSFIDCGDTFTAPDMLHTMLNTIDENPGYIAYFWSHNEEKDDVVYSIGSQHNRIHGKIYRRQFLIDHNITFCPSSSRANEDIGFNLAIRMIDENDAINAGTPFGNIWCSEEPAVNWVNIGPSIVRADNTAYYYRDQNMGLALNAEHAFNLVPNAHEEVYIKQAYLCMAHEYYFYIATRSCRPEFTAEAYAGALYCYKNIFRKYRYKKPAQMRKAYYHTLADMISSDWDPIHEQLIPLDYEGFLNELEEICKKEDIEIAQKVANAI
jgi:glycosyltransferase involved in cell wall biosynthesis